MEKLNLNLSAPWVIYQHKVKALFERDPDITVGDIYEPDGGEVAYAFDIEVRNHEKFLALDKLLPSVKEFGNVAVGIVIFDEENSLTGGNNDIELYRTLFQGNPIVKDIIEACDHAGTRHGFVCFQPEVIRFFADDTSSYDGCMSVLGQDIAREIFCGSAGLHFCTAGLDG